MSPCCAPELVNPAAILLRQVCGIQAGRVDASMNCFRRALIEPTYLARHGAPQAPHELPAHRIIARRFLNGQTSPWSFETDDGNITTFDPGETAVLTLSAPESVVRAACDGVGIAQAGVHLAWDHLRSGALKVVLHHQHQPGSYEMVMQYPHRALLPPRVQVTLDYLQEAFSKDERLHVPLNALSAYVA